MQALTLRMKIYLSTQSVIIVRILSIAYHQAPLWSVEELKGYILFVQRNFTPLLSSEAQLILTRYYQYVRGHNNSVAQATVRLLESLIRLGQAHARLMMRKREITMVVLLVSVNPRMPL